MKRSTSSLPSPKRNRPLIEPLEARIAPAANNWIALGSGNWNTPGNWSDGVPTPDDVVTINPTGDADDHDRLGCAGGDFAHDAGG